MKGIDCFHRILWDFDHPGYVELLEKLDAQEFMRQARDAGFESVGVFAKDSLGQSLYPTRAGHVHPGLKRDFLGEMTSAAKGLGLAVIAYYNGTQDPQHAQQRPEWREQSGAERSQFAAETQQATPFVCLHSGYVEECMIPQLREIVTSYPVDGVFLDIFGLPHTRRVCACAACVRDFAAQVGGELPSRGTERARWLQYAQWRGRRHQEMQERVLAGIHAARADVTVAINYAFSARQPETARGVSYLSLDVEEHTNPMLGVPTYLRYGAQHGLTNEAFVSHMQHWWWDWDLRPLPAMQLQAAEIMANGGVVCVGSNLHPSGELDGRAMQQLKGFNQFLAERAPFCRGATPVADVAVLHSGSTLASRSAVDYSHGTGAAALMTLRGAARIFLEGHVAFKIIDTPMLMRGLSECQLLVLPEQCALDDGACAAITAYVQGGGKVLAIGATATETGEGAARAEGGGLDALMGIRSGGTLPHACGYGQFRAEARAPFAGALLLEGAWQCVEANGARVLADLLEPVHGGSGQRAYGALGVGLPPVSRKVVGAAVTLREVGKGAAAYVAGPVCTQHGAKTQLEWREVVLWLTNLLAPEPLLRSGAPVVVEIALARQGANLICHVINYANEKGHSTRQLAEWVPPIFDIPITVRAGDVTRVTAYPGGTPLAFESDGRCVKFCLPRLDVHSWVVLQGRQS